MSSCPKCGRAKVRRRVGLRRCGHCGILPDLPGSTAHTLALEVAKKDDHALLTPLESDGLC